MADRLPSIDAAIELAKSLSGATPAQEIDNSPQEHINSSRGARAWAKKRHGAHKQMISNIHNHKTSIENDEIGGTVHWVKDELNALVKVGRSRDGSFPTLNVSPRRNWTACQPLHHRISFTPRCERC
jgi:hypothetical protein